MTKSVIWIIVMAALVAGGAVVGAVAGLLATWKWDPQGPMPR